MKRNIGGFEFRYEGVLALKTRPTGTIVEYSHRLPEDVRANRYAAGPFCAFSPSGASSEAGVYAIVVGDEVKYIGECIDLNRRFGPNGYGYIAARKCHADGQATNCK